jgi:hypothetical protein
LVADAFITELKTIFNKTDLEDATVETLVNAVIDEITLNGYSIAIMTGTAGSKTFPTTLTSPERAAIRRIFRTIYASWYRNAANGTPSVGNVNTQYSDLLSNPTVLGMIKETAKNLKLTLSTPKPPIYFSNEPIPNQQY